MPLEGLIFDLDGTLVNTLPVCYAAFRETLLIFTGRVYTDEEIRGLFGPSEEGSLKRVLPETAWEAAIAQFFEEYERAHHLCTAPFPGLEELFHWLDAQQIRKAIVTGKGAGSAAISLRHTGLGSHFDLVLCGSEWGPVKPQCIQQIVTEWGIPQERVAYVGDAPSDIPSAQQAGVLPIAAAWADTADYERLAALAPPHLFRTVSDFAAWLREPK